MVIWKKVNLRDKGIIVEKSPTISKGQKRFEKYDIEGRNGVLIIDKGTYDPFIVTLECHIDTDITSIDKVKEFLDGYGTLSFDNEKEYTAIIQNQIEFEKVQNFRKFPIQFLCNPISKSLESTIVNVNNSPTQIQLDNSNFNVEPIIKIKGSGNTTITFNGKSFILNNLDNLLTYTLDSEFKEIVNSNGINSANQMYGDFPILVPGENIITYTGNITEFTIEYKNSYL